MRRRFLVATIALVLVTAGCGDDDDDSGAERTTTTTTTTTASTTTTTPPAPTTAGPVTEPPAELVVEVLVSGLEVPWDVAFTPGSRAFVTERSTGVVSEVAEDGTVAEVQRFDVDPAGEGGLLGLAASPTDDGLLIAYLTTAEDNRIVAFRPGGEPRPLLTGIPAGTVHNGGRIAFGPDGRLYAGTGDSGDEGLAQDPASLGGKILRLEPDGSVPADNPIDGSPVYSRGHRNVQGLAWDATGQLYATEFGPDRDDEVNRIEAGANYGWPEVTGAAGVEGFVDPVAVFQPPEASPSGAAFVLGDRGGAWAGDLVFASLRGERLYRVAVDGAAGELRAEELSGRFGRLRHVEQAPDGSLWVLTSNRDGRGEPGPDDDRILRLVPPG
ncbi:PQQ-dependent sugar dehydrogenase [soil metagenome]